MPNRLANETSPYLRQHADNPVDWYPWGAEAFAKAAAENKPVLLSVGYAACHWCHVMAHESFEDAETAALMNELFVNVKVDREERPDVDAIYMQAVQAMVGQGGWPMTVALTSKGEPFWGGTYFPPVDGRGMPSFKRVLATLADAWRNRRDSIERTTDAMRDLYKNAAMTAASSGVIEPSLLERAFGALSGQYDAKLGGFGRAPKFPQTMALDFCLRWWSRSGNHSARDIARDSFVAMMRGGIYDQIGGGFHRYSVDAEWLVPHFEKMLYDNALLVRLGTHLWQATRDEEIARCVEETILWLLREMTSPLGGFYASLDADSEGHEGTFYVWSSDEFNALLGEDATVMRGIWGVTKGGNFEERNILHLKESLSLSAIRAGMSAGWFDETVQRAKRVLFQQREGRVRPGRDEKVLAGWNGLMTRALADAARVFHRADWLHAAQRNGEFLRDTLVQGGRVMRVHMDGVTRVQGFLEDHAAVALAFVALHEATFDGRWILEARIIGREMRRHFRDAETGAWFDTADDAEALITRPRDVFDNAVPAGASLAQELVLRLAELEGDTVATAEVVTALAAQADPMARWPQGFGHLLGVTDLALFGAVALALVGNPASAEFQALAATVADRYLPTLVLAAGSGESTDAPAALLSGRPMLENRATAYLCRGFVCQLPTTNSAELRAQLDQMVGGGVLR